MKKNNQQIVNEFSKVGFQEILDLLDQIRNGDISNVKSFKLNFENNVFLSEISYYNICKELEQFYINKLKSIINKPTNENNSKSKKKLDNKTEFDIFDPNKFHKNSYIIPYFGSIPNPFDKSLELFDYIESKLLFGEYNLLKENNESTKNGSLNYESFEISKIFEKILRSTVHESMILTDMKNKDFLIYLINLWSVIFNEYDLSETENADSSKFEIDSFEYDVSQLTIYFYL